MYDCRYWLWLSQAFEPGAVKCDKLLQAFNYNPKAIYEAERDAFEPFCASSPRALNALCNKNLDNVYKTLEFCEKNNVGILTMDNDKYPSSLLRIDGQPPVIYYKGTIPDFETRFCLSVVGTRHVSPYGSSAAYTIAHDIASADGIIVSGMALGSDTAAHRGALDAKGTTIAFLGSGIDVPYPKENAFLMEEIIESGAVMTDYPPHARPEGRHFPVRNRLISGVSHGVLVIEAGKRSGALITAEHAHKQGKYIYAIPGRIGELNSVGTNELLVKGAKTVTKATDIMNDYRFIFGLSEEVNLSGFSRFKREGPKRDLSVPYQTPTYNPYASNKLSFNDKNSHTDFYDDFMRYNPKKNKKPNAPEPQAAINKNPLPMYIDLGIEEKQSERIKLEEPKPIIMFRDFDDEEHARAYMSMSAEEKAEIDRIDEMAGRPILRYRSDPIPPGGYKVNITKEKAEKFDRITEDLEYRRKIKMSDADIVRPIFDYKSDLKELEAEYDRDAKRREDNLKRRQILKENGTQDYAGLSSVEISILELLREKGKITVDSMSHLGIPLPKLLSVLTVLEVKGRILQYSGGYFEINPDF